MGKLNFVNSHSIAQMSSWSSLISFSFLRQSEISLLSADYWDGLILSWLRLRIERKKHDTNIKLLISSENTEIIPNNVRFSDLDRFKFEVPEGCIFQKMICSHILTQSRCNIFKGHAACCCSGWLEKLWFLSNGGEKLWFGIFHEELH